MIAGSCEEERKTWYVPDSSSDDQDGNENLEDWAPKVPVMYYGSFYGENADGRPVYPWWGEHVVLLTYESDYDPQAMKKWTDAADRMYEFYIECTREAPPVMVNCFMNGRITIAQSENWPAAAVGWIWNTGIAIADGTFDGLYNSYLNGNGDTLTPYEMGRNFWKFGGKITYNGDEPECTGYSVFMRRILTVELLGQNLDPDADTPTVNLDKILGIYLASGKTYENTIAVNQGVDNPYDSSSQALFASFLFELQKKYGGTDWVIRFWNYVDERPDAASEQTAVDNIIVAASQASGKNLCSLFEEWKWPVSQNARATLNEQQRDLEQDAMDFQRKLQNNAFATQQRAEEENARLMKKQGELQALSEKLQNELLAEQQKNSTIVMDSVHNVLKEVSDEFGYKIIMSDPLYGVESLDITGLVLERLNKKYKPAEK